KTSQTVKPNHVISTDPQNGTTVAAHTKVKIVVSKGVGTKTVPRLVGLKQTDAQSKLTSLGLNAQVQYRPSLQSAGTAIGQHPRPGIKVPPGSSVTIFVSQSGAQVPNVIGQPRQEAKSNLEQAGFVVSVQTGTPPASGFAPGSVYAVQPHVGRILAKGSTV